MGSVRKKKEKQKDFQKAKLKVGKTKLKPTNHTDTSFVAKTISLPSQSIVNKTSTTSTAEFEADLIKRLSLTKHHANQTRKETLIYIEQHLPNEPTLYKQILTAVVPLIIDQSRSVREALISLLTAASEKQSNLMELHARSVILYIHSAMTHINSDIRNDSVKFLDILIKYGKDAVIRSAWVKTLKAYFSLLSWTLNDSKQSVSLAITTSSVTKTSSKSKGVILDSFVKFIKAGVQDEQLDPSEVNITIHHLTGKYLIPSTPQPFAQLKLFQRETLADDSTTKNKNTVDTTIDLNTVSCEDSQTRTKVLVEFFIPQIIKHSKEVVKEGGEQGKAARSLEKLCDAILVKVKEEEEAARD
ncbi:hypothetical protein WICPIJ_008597 [Wickerhamomyces pijperi]|uniref:Pre-rRNA-processing protein n=1 Tax=Wickerhamomyces pijperi TaxID=599730 RepID=A0A9P8PWM9_WICPI|nr:hypothetical protein WICPIJ_008597 [Wickerhamomyces pijperi]